MRVTFIPGPSPFADERKTRGRQQQYTGGADLQQHRDLLVSNMRPELRYRPVHRVPAPKSTVLSVPWFRRKRAREGLPSAQCSYRTVFVGESCSAKASITGRSLASAVRSQYSRAAGLRDHAAKVR